MEGVHAEHECVEACIEALDNCYLSFSALEYSAGTPVDLDMFPHRESWEMIESSHILYRESVL
jgi:hypothetical protein